RARRLVQQAVNPFGHEARLPAPDRRLAFAGLPLDGHRANPSGAQQHDPRPPYMLLRTVPRADHRFQPFPIARTNPDLDAFSHPARPRICETPLESFVSANPLDSISRAAFLQRI